MRDLNWPTTLDVSDDRELVRLAQSGDAAGMGALLARHRAGMLAVALGMLGRPAEAEDAVQDAMLVALTRIGDLRDPGAAGPWLRMIVRNCCRMQRRAATPLPVGMGDPLSGTERGTDPQEMVERHATRDWVWHALEQLSPPLRVVTLLRYFTSVRAYEHIAAVCGVPVGTVRSRLNAARAQLSGLLLATSSSAHGDMARITAARVREAEDAVEAGHRGRFGEFLQEGWDPGFETVWPDGRSTHGIAPLAGVVDSSMGVGVRQRLTDVVASGDIVVWKTDVLNPPSDPLHCPPHTWWLLFLESGRVRQLRLFHRFADDR